MPKKKTVVKTTKQKLSPAERSQVAKDRWAKIRAAKVAQDKPDPVKEWVDEAVRDGLLNAKPDTPAPPIAEQEKKYNTLMETVPQIINAMLEADAKVPNQPPVAPPIEAPAPQLAPVKPPKQKRYTGPKEFSVALKAAENRLAKAITERAAAAGQLAALNAEIPSLLGIINALKGSQNAVTTVASLPMPYDFSAPYQPPVPLQAPVDPMDAIRAAMAQPPVSRAMGNAVQFGPDVVGSVESEEDDPDRFIVGPAAGEKGWIGG
jgi:hypothetical protein